MDGIVYNEREEAGTFENMTGLMEDTGESLFRQTVSLLALIYLIDASIGEYNF